MLVAFDKEPNDLFLLDFLLVADYVGPLEGPHPWRVHTLGGSTPLEGPAPLEQGSVRCASRHNTAQFAYIFLFKKNVMLTLEG